MLKSKRFLSLVAEVILFIIGAFILKIEPEPLAKALVFLFAPYQIVQSCRKSNI